MKSTRRVLTIVLSLALVFVGSMPALAGGGGHCAYRLIPTGKGVAPHAIATRLELIGCYATFADAVAAGSGGAIRLGSDVSPASLTDREIAASTRSVESGRASIMIGTEFDLTSFLGTSRNFFAASTCTSSTTWESSYVGDAWNDRFESGKGFGGCDSNKKFAASNFGGASITCTPNCITYGGLSNQVSSLRWRV